MKATVVTDEAGNVLAVQQGHASETDRSSPGAVVVAGPGQTIQEIEIPGGEAIDNLEELHQLVAEILA